MKDRPVATETPILDLDRWEAKLPELRKEYDTENPFPHIVIDDFLNEDAAQQAMNAFPGVADSGWIHYVHFNEKKHGLNKADLLPPFLKQTIDTLNSYRFVAWLSELTGIEGLKADPMMEGGGLHQSLRGGFLNVHADFTVHPHKRNWRRRVNVLVYLNEGWQPEYRGEIELWTRDMKHCVRKALPIFNRCVIFNTDEDSFHGLPDPIQCPEGMTRKSIALYYFTEEKDPIKVKMRSTNYRARPTDDAKHAFFVWLDKRIVSTYSAVKGILGLNDDFASKVLNALSGGGKKKKK